MESVKEVNLTQTQVKPRYLVITEKWTTKIVLAWCILFAAIGVIFIGLAEGIAIPILTIVMLFAGKWIIKFLFSVQKVNPFISRKRFDFAIMFFWGAGIYCFLSFLAYGVLWHLDELKHAYFYIAAAIFPLGVCLGAAEKWPQRFDYDR